MRRAVVTARPGAPGRAVGVEYLDVVHPRQTEMIAVPDRVELATLDVRSRQCTRLWTRLDPVQSEGAFQPAAQAPVLVTTTQARQIDEGDTVAARLDQCDQPSEGDPGLGPAHGLGVEDPALRLDLHDLHATGAQHAQEAPATGDLLEEVPGCVEGQLEGLDAVDDGPDRVVRRPVALPGVDVGPRLRIAESGQEGAVVGVELHVEQILMAVPGGVAVDEAGGGAFGGLAGTQDGEAGAVMDRCSRCSWLAATAPVEQREGGGGAQSGGVLEGLFVQGLEGVAPAERLLHAGGAAITEVQGDPPEEDHVEGCAHESFEAWIVGDAREAGGRVGARLQSPQGGDLVFQLEDAARVRVVITTRGLRRHAVDGEVVADEDAQAIRPAVVEPVHHVGGIVTIEGPQCREHAQAGARFVAQGGAVDGALQQAAQSFLDQLAAGGAVGQRQPLRPGASDPLVIIAQQRPRGVVGEGEPSGDAGHVDGVGERTFAIQSGHRILHAGPVRGAAVPGHLDLLRRAVAELRRGGDIDLLQ